MIATLRAYLWKESRDGRALLVGIPAALTVAIVLAGVFMPAKAIHDPFFPQIAAAGAFVLGLLAIASELVPGEARRGKLSFLLRQPAGLGTAYVAKVIYVLTALVLLTAFGYAAASAAALARGGVIALPTGDLGSDLWRLAWNPPPALLLAALAGVIGWTLVVSCWLPRGSLSVPTAALALGVFGVPLWLLYSAAPGLTPCTPFRTALLVVLGMAPFAIAWISFVRGRRFGRGPWSGAWRGLIAMLVLATPAWAFGAFEVRDWLSVDPTSPRFRIGETYVGEGGRYAFVNAQMVRRFQDPPKYEWHGSQYGPVIPLVVDLETGGWRRVGDPGDGFVGGPWYPDTSVIIMGDESASDAKHWFQYFDGATGELVKTGWAHLLHEKVEAYRPDLPAPDGYKLTSRVGLGYRAYRDGKRYIYDPFRKRCYPAAGYWNRVAVRPGRWLVEDWIRPEGERQYRRRHLLVDPDSGERTEVGGVGRSFVLLNDGRVLTTRRQSDAGESRLVAVDPESGDTLDLGVPATLVSSCGQTPQGAHILSIRTGDAYNSGRLARLEPKTLSLSWFDASFGRSRYRVWRIAGEDTLIGVDDRQRLVRIRLGSPEPEVLFPREVAR